ncbi:MAG: sensor histidine kinase, partial [Planctomycetota bacterium]
RIFERFERATDRARSASLGLGLWIVRHVITALQGRIAVTSILGAGSTFTVTLPVERQHESVREAA